MKDTLTGLEDKEGIIYITFKICYINCTQFLCNFIIRKAVKFMNPMDEIFKNKKDEDLDEIEKLFKYAKLDDAPDEDRNDKSYNPFSHLDDDVED